MHPQVIGGGHRMLMLERLVEHVSSYSGVIFKPLGDYVGRWKDENPLDRWVSENSLYAGGGR